MADGPRAQLPTPPVHPAEPDEPAKPWTTLTSELVHTTPWLALRQDQVRTHTGRAITYRRIQMSVHAFMHRVKMEPVSAGHT